MASTLSSTKGGKRRSASTGPEKSQKHFEQLRRYILGRNPKLEEIRGLIKQDPSCVQQSDAHHGLFPLHWACVFQNPLSIVQALLEAYPTAIDALDSDGRTPLHHACRPEGRVELVEYLLEHNRRVVTLRDNRGKTPLHCACAEFVPADMVRLLLQANPSAVKIRTRDGHTPLHCACEFNAPMDTIKLLVDAYPEAVKYIREGNGDGRFEQAKEYLAFKVQQTEAKAERAKTPTQHLGRYDDENNRIPENTTSESDIMRRRLEEEERKIEAEEKELNRVAQHQQQLALKRLEQQELDVEQQAAELDRLIQQKEKQLESNRFQKETERLFGGKRVLNDSGIVSNRSFGMDIGTPPPIFQKPPPGSSNPPVTSAKPRPDQYTTPSVLSSRGVSAVLEEEDDELFGALRGNNSTQPLYLESKVGSNWMGSTATSKGRDPSVASQYDANDSLVSGDEPESTVIKKSPSFNPLQEQLQQAFQMLEDAEERRKKEIQEAHEQQKALQDELGKLMEKLEDSEGQRSKQEALKRKQQEEEEEKRRKEEEEERRRKAEEAEEQRRKQQAAEEEQKRKQQQQRPPRGINLGTNTSVTAESSDQSAPKRQAEHFALNSQADNVTLKDVHGRTPLHIACAHGASYTSLQFLLQQFPLAIYGTDDDGNTPLHHACACSKTPMEVLQLLLDIFPAGCWMANCEGQLPLHKACEHHGHRVEVLQLLMETARGVEAAAAEGEEGSSALGPPRL